MPINTVIHTGEQSIDKVLQAGLPVVLVFWKAGVPLNTDGYLDDLAGNYAGKILIAKVDVGNETGLLERFNIDFVPSYVFIKSGSVEATGTGQISEQSLKQWVLYLTQGGARPQTPHGERQPVSKPMYTPSQHHHGNGKSAGATTQTRSTAVAGPIVLTDANFTSIVNQPGPILVDFWAEWCGPCRMIAPAIEQLADEFTGRARVGKLNVDQNPATAQRYKIMSIPALYIFKNGKVVDQIIGAQPVNVLRQRLEAQVD